MTKSKKRAGNTERMDQVGLPKTGIVTILLSVAVLLILGAWKAIEIVFAVIGMGQA